MKCKNHSLPIVLLFLLKHKQGCFVPQASHCVEMCELQLIDRFQQDNQPRNYGKILRLTSPTDDVLRRNQMLWVMNLYFISANEMAVV